MASLFFSIVYTTKQNLPAGSDSARGTAFAKMISQPSKSTMKHIGRPLNGTENLRKRNFQMPNLKNVLYGGVDQNKLKHGEILEGHTQSAEIHFSAG